jgi:3-hydroxybutyryl-CoA dehydrogenase
LRDIRTLGVVGAGTMGSGIAQVAALGDFETYLHDPFPEALERGIGAVLAGLAKGAERGRWSADEAAAAETRLHPASKLEDLAPCELVIEASPEDLELKRELFSKLSQICPPDVVLATNTSSLPVTAMATAAARPENVVGMHFFNPAPLMQLLEVVAGADSSEEALATARAVGERMGKAVITARDGPGFLANRCARPFGLEALKLLAEGAADHATIDRIVRMGGGFRMGPFELMDLVGIDVGFEVSKSFWEQSFHEPRWRPSMIQARMVQAGRFGRKAGRGYYEYEQGKPHREDDPEQPSMREQDAVIVIEGDSQVAEELWDMAVNTGYDPRRMSELGNDPATLYIDGQIGRLVEDNVAPPAGASVCVLCAEGSLSELGLMFDGAIGFHVLPPLSETGVVELTRSGSQDDVASQRVEHFFRTLGKHVEWVDDTPGLVLGRIVCQLVNEACFAIQERVGSAGDIDTALRLGFNYPRGPLEWADLIGVEHVVATLDALYEELHEERYRAAPLLRRMIAEGRLGRWAGRGFFTYPEDEY